MMKQLSLLLLLFFSLTGAVNILPNPSFEVWLDTLGVKMPLGWITSEYLHPGSAVKDTNSNTGSFSLRLSGGDTVAFASSMTIVRAGVSYEFSGYAAVPGIISGGFLIEFLTLRGQPTGTPELVPVYYSNGYRRYHRWVTAPDSAFFLTVSCLALPGGEVYYDDVTVEDTSRLGVEEEQPVGCRRFRVQKLVLPVMAFDPGPGIKVYDVLGRRVAAGCRCRGVYFVVQE
jgi:hypothetical protein